MEKSHKYIVSFSQYYM